MMTPPNSNQIDPSAQHATLGFLLAAAVEELLPEREFYIEHSYVGGYYCHFGIQQQHDPEAIGRLEGRMVEYLNGERPLVLETVDRKELSERFRRRKRADKLEILDRLDREEVPAARYGHYLDYRLEPMLTDMAALQGFRLEPYDSGFVLRFPTTGPLEPMRDSPKLYRVIQQRHDWGRALHVNNLRQLNRRLEGKLDRELILVAEALHEKTIAEIAVGLAAGYPQKRVVFISGPSSSGKTTFAKRLAIQLQANLLNTISISLDDYFLDRADMQPQTDGTLDFEGLEAVDVARLVSAIRRLLAGETIPRRRFSFKRGQGYDNDETMQLGKDQLLVVEGLHGLNPVFTDELGADQVQRIYVSAITQLNIDNEHRVSGSDNRLLRRLVRDAQFRGYNAEETLLRWPAVRRGESKHVFKYQEEADFMFNSALVFELGVLRSQAELVLRAVAKSSPAWEQAQRLLIFLSLVAPVPLDPIPRDSILREFIGRSVFEY
ncbi:MAG: nucleoside kinase [Candidatus Marinimicrobia bacterium]|nr:nucleoside kinase [Candidatus Neomarinimicrobiota bacterium]